MAAARYFTFTIENNCGKALEFELRIATSVISGSVGANNTLTTSGMAGMELWANGQLVKVLDAKDKGGTVTICG